MLYDCMSVHAPPISQVLCCPRGRTALWIQSMLLQSEDLGSNPGSTTYFPGAVTSFAPFASVRSTKLTLSVLEEEKGHVHTGVWNSACRGTLHGEGLLGIGLQPCREQHCRQCRSRSHRPHTVGRKATLSCPWRGPRE